MFATFTSLLTNKEPVEEIAMPEGYALSLQSVALEPTVKGIKKKRKKSGSVGEEEENGSVSLWLNAKNMTGIATKTLLGETLIIYMYY